MPSLTSIAGLALLALAAATPLQSRDVDVKCLEIGETATASWTNAEGKKCTWTGVVGSNFGSRDGKVGDYGCIGRCGVGCEGFSLGSVYTQHCFSHDVCSWFSGHGKDPGDPNCGAGYKSSVDDFLFGALKGCSHENPGLPVERPTGEPECV